MGEPNLHRRGELVGDPAHGVGAQHQQLSPARHQRQGLGREELAGLVPPAGPLELLHGGEVDRPQQAVCRMQPAEALPDGLVTNR